MLFDNNRTNLRKFFFDTWHKMQTQEKLDPLERQIAAIISLHPEYHPLLSNPEKNLEKDYREEFGEVNPFFHMGLHQAIAEQISTNRPKGITRIYHALCKQIGDVHQAEHQLIETLAAALWQAHQDQKFDEKTYLKKLKKLLKN